MPTNHCLRPVCLVHGAPARVSTVVVFLGPYVFMARHRHWFWHYSHSVVMRGTLFAANHVP